MQNFHTNKNNVSNVVKLCAQLFSFQPGTLALLMVTNIVLVCDGQYLLCVGVHLFIFNNSNIHAVVKVMYTTLLLSLEYK